jgi:uncharacterized protein YbjQ (UPF0145 family)
MPWGFRRRPDDNGPDARARQAESIRALEAGGIPAEAAERLGRQSSGSLPWTSTLTVPDFLTCRALGLRPVGQVMGSSVMHIGFNPQWVYGVWQNGDIAAQSRAIADARLAALDRLRQEAQVLGAHGVVSVTVNVSRPAWGADLVEFQAMGTAVVLPGQPVPEQPFLGTVSAQDTEKLWAAGYLPMNIVFATTAYYVLTDWMSQMQESSWTNQEVTSLTEAVYDARAFVTHRMAAAAREVGADGVLGAEWDMTVEELEVERPLYGGVGGGFMGGYGPTGRVTDHIVYITVTGTAIGALASRLPHDPPRAVISLTDDPAAARELPGRGA